MLRNPLSNSMGLLVTVLFVTACGGADAPEPETAGDAPLESEAPAPMPEAAPAEAPASPGAAPAASGGDAVMIAAGEQVYRGQGLCFTCHGQDAQGTPLAPNLTDSEWMWIEDPTTDLQTKLVTMIRTGVAQPQEYPAPMPPMGGAQLSEEQLQSVAAYVASISS